ncbi:MAG: SAM-dependent methyltransferase, partial [Pseudomonadota bacterium]
HRDVNQSVSFITGHDQSGATPSSLNWEAIAQGSQVIVIYMGMKHAASITAKLIAAGRDPQEPCAVVSSATTDDQRVLETTLSQMAADIDASGLEPPAILCIGRSILMRQALDWQTMMTGEAPRNADPLNRGRPAEAS